MKKRKINLMIIVEILLFFAIEKKKYEKICFI